MAKVRTKNIADDGEDPFIRLELRMTRKEATELAEGKWFSLSFHDPIEQPEIHDMFVGLSEPEEPISEK